MNITDPLSATREISNSFGLIIGLITIGLIFLIVIWVLIQFRNS